MSSKAFRLKEFVVLKTPSAIAVLKLAQSEEKIRQLREDLSLIALNKSAHLKPDCDAQEPWLRMGCGESFIVRGLERDAQLRVKASRLGKFWRAKWWVIRHKKMNLIEIVRVL